MAPHVQMSKYKIYLYWREKGVQPLDVFVMLFWDNWKWDDTYMTKKKKNQHWISIFFLKFDFNTCIKKITTTMKTFQVLQQKTSSWFQRATSLNNKSIFSVKVYMEEDAERELLFHLKKGTLKDYLGYFTATEPALIVQGRYWRAAQGRRDLLEIPIYTPHTYWFLTPSSNERPRGIIYLAGFAVRRSQSA